MDTHLFSFWSQLTNLILYFAFSSVIWFLHGLRKDGCVSYPKNFLLWHSMWTSINLLARCNACCIENSLFGPFSIKFYRCWKFDLFTAGISSFSSKAVCSLKNWQTSLSVGFVGYPNVGKSSVIYALHTKKGSFSTLHPLCQKFSHAFLICWTKVSIHDIIYLRLLYFC